ncbi:flagellar basal body L-ring protein FlgH [bacterium]|nr:flagellar basal body L-ring protein FlgH [bacterium]
MSVGNKLWMVLIAGLFTGLFVTTVGHAESLSGTGAGIFSSEKSFQPGDIVTVIVSENAKAEQSASTKLSKETGMGYSAGGLLGTLIPSAALGVTSDQDGRGDLARKGKMEAKVGAVVEEVLTSGNLRIQGKQEIKFDSGTQVIQVAGIIRPRDVSATNEVYSFKMANAQILYSGKGALHEKARTGYLSRLLDLLWIF